MKNALRLTLIFVLGLSFSGSLVAEEVAKGAKNAKGAVEDIKGLDKEACEKLAQPAPDPAPVDIDKVLRNLRELKVTRGESLVKYTPAFEKEIRAIFDLSLVKTKTEQFYRLLYVVSKHVLPGHPNMVSVDPLMVRQVLLSTAVFDTPDVPNEIRKVVIDRAKKEDPQYEVEFASEVTRMPLNLGRGFYAYTHKLCQKTVALHFYKNFSFTLRELKNGNIIARHFKGVDFFGSFGTRGFVDIDFEYVELQSVEFYKGTKTGEVTAGISRMEFKKNEHSSILALITRFVKNSSEQALGW